MKAKSIRDELGQVCIWLLKTLFQFYTSFLGILGPFAFSVFCFCHLYGGRLKIERILEAALGEDNLLQ